MILYVVGVALKAFHIARYVSPAMASGYLFP